MIVEMRTPDFYDPFNMSLEPTLWQLEKIEELRVIGNGDQALVFDEDDEVSGMRPTIIWQVLLRGLVIYQGENQPFFKIIS